MLLAEYYRQQQAEDWRFYRLICINFEKPPEPGSIFPMLADLKVPEEDDLLDDEIVSQSLSAELRQYSSR